MKKIKLLCATDLHQSKKLYSQLSDAVSEHLPDVMAFVGDFLDAFNGGRGKHDETECAQLIHALPCTEIVFTRGNHEHENWSNFKRAWQECSPSRPLHNLHGSAHRVGPLVLVGFPCHLGDESDYAAGQRELPLEADAWLEPLVRSKGDSAKTVWLAHEPPSGTPLTVSDGPVSGNPEWTYAIERYRPALVVSGHDHNTPIRRRKWHHRIQGTTCVNAGQKLNGPLHYTVVDFEFRDEHSEVPSKMEVTSYPKGQTLALCDKLA